MSAQQVQELMAAYDKRIAELMLELEAARHLIKIAYGGVQTFGLNKERKDWSWFDALCAYRDIAGGHSR